MNNYSVDDKKNFNRREQWIAFESIFRTLCEFYKDKDNTRKDLMIEATEIVEWMGSQWPMQEIKDEPFPTKPLAEGKICPRCGANMKRVPAGTSKKTGKPYNAFWSCGECKQTANYLWKD